MKTANRFVFGAFATLLSMALLSSNSSAQDQLAAGSSSKQIRLQTVNSIPFQKLNVATRDKISTIVNKPSIYRRLPVTSISADPDHFRYLVRYPEVIVNIWQLMGVTQMETERTGPYTVKTNDGAGTISSLELVYGTENLHIFYGSGTYEGPVLKRKLSGDCVLVLRTDSRSGRDGKPVQTSQLDVFLKVKNATAGLIAKTISPLVGSTADHNFVESLKFVQRLNETTEKNGPGVAKMSDKLDLDETVRDNYKKVVDRVFQRAIKRAAPEATAESRPALMARPTSQTSLRAAGASAQRSPTSSAAYGNFSDSNQTGFSGSQQTNRTMQMQNGQGLPARGSNAPSYNRPTNGSPAAGYYGQSNGGNVRQPSNAQQVQGANGYPVLRIPPYDPSSGYDPSKRYQTHSQVSGALPQNPQTQRAVQPRHDGVGTYPSQQPQNYPQPASGWRGR